ncbi:MAG: hypothetical protein J5635_03895 [Paludibacteraceae bacterium]|nr:hypothetical protein [Paludibacteraceae bacterium]
MKSQHLISIVFATLLTGYVLFALVFYPAAHTTTICREVDVRIEDLDERAYVSPMELRTYVNNTCGSLVGDSVDPALLANVERQLLSHPMIRTAEAWCSPEGVLHLNVTQRQPVLRVLGDENYYVDSDRRKMPVRNTTAAYVPVVTGRVPFRFVTGELYDFILWMEDDAYWRAQVEQINVVSPARIELVPRVGSGIIVLGTLEDYPTKLRKLKKLYQDGFSSFGWNDYAEVDLRFRGQVVCRK